MLAATRMASAMSDFGQPSENVLPIGAPLGYASVVMVCRTSGDVLNLVRVGSRKIPVVPPHRTGTYNPVVQFANRRVGFVPEPGLFDR